MSTSCCVDLQTRLWKAFNVRQQHQLYTPAMFKTIMPSTTTARLNTAVPRFAFLNPVKWTNLVAAGRTGRTLTTRLLLMSTAPVSDWRRVEGEEEEEKTERKIKTYLFVLLKTDCMHYSFCRLKV